jgi:hypothetical protein
MLNVHAPVTFSVAMDHVFSPRILMSGEIRHLLKLAQKIQHWLGAEEDAVTVANLTNDMKLVKAEIGRRILDMPDEPIASIFAKPSPAKSKSSPAHRESPRSVRKVRRRIAQRPIPLEVSAFISRKFAEFLAERLLPHGT